MISYLDLRQVNARYDDEIRNAVSRVLDSGWYLRGEATRRFEQHYADYIGTRYCVGCANGLDALTLMPTILVRATVSAAPTVWMR